jgi:ATP-dependent Clp protease ATP-binding subunit ClpA
VSSDETQRLIKMEEVLHGRVIGQEEAVTAISRAIRRARVGLKNPNRPIASFIFSGECGVEMCVSMRACVCVPETKSSGAVGDGMLQ